MTAKDQIPVMFPEGVRYIDAVLNGKSMERQPMQTDGWVFRLGRNDQWEAIEA